MRLKIPQEFTLLGRTYTVEMNRDLFERSSLYGDFSSTKFKIRLQPTGSVYDSENIEQVDIAQATVDETYLHEVTHAILDAMDNPMGDDESFVTIFSKCLYQILTTGKGEDK